MKKFSIILLTLAIGICQGLEDKSNEFDFLMFTQIWPITSCLTWEDSGKGHTCTIDDSKDDWTIHGVWPTKNHQIGPLFCNKSVPFDEKALEPIMSDLKDRWTDVRRTSDKDGFWRHEWEKHGTCAMQLPSMATEYLYFKKALDLNVQYNVTKLLLASGVTPGESYHPEKVLDVLSQSLGGDAKVAINCAHDSNFNNRLFYEIIVCLNKNFERIGCENTAGGLYGSCKHKEFDLMQYPDSIHKRWWRNNLAWIFIPLTLVCFGLLACLAYHYFITRRRQGYSPIAASFRQQHREVEQRSL